MRSSHLRREAALNACQSGSLGFYLDLCLKWLRIAGGGKNIPYHQKWAKLPTIFFVICNIPNTSVGTVCQTLIIIHDSAWRPRALGRGSSMWSECQCRGREENQQTNKQTKYLPSPPPPNNKENCVQNFQKVWANLLLRNTTNKIIKSKLFSIWNINYQIEDFKIIILRRIKNQSHNFTQNHKLGHTNWWYEVSWITIKAK